MAKSKIRLSKAQYVQRGYGIVEPNHLSAPRNGQVYGQLPAEAKIEVLENGQFVRYDYANGVCNVGEGNGPWFMVYNEVKVYEDFQGDADFAMIRDNYTGYIYSALPEDMPTGSVMTPRVFKMSVGDLYTTNTVNETELAKGDTLRVDAATGYLTKTGNVGPTFEVVKVYTTPDLQNGVKLQCVAE